MGGGGAGRGSWLSTEATSGAKAGRVVGGVEWGSVFSGSEAGEIGDESLAFSIPETDDATSGESTVDAMLVWSPKGCWSDGTERVERGTESW